ncbi:MAG: ATP-binding protein [Deltaproteobacteria bacterium]|nr:ATP-binding protein [Deltaproteobacteria bacterium]
MEIIKREADLPDEKDFLDFVGASFLHFGYQFPKQDQPADRRAIRREKDVDQVARLIAKLGGGEQRIIHVTRADLLRFLNWESRFEFRFKHEFPVDETLYQPIIQTVEELEASINQFKSGYIALIGTPGSGKSTTLTQTLRYRKGLRIIRYYAYVPNSPWQEGRGEAISFLHDLHLALQRHGIYVRTGIKSQPESLEELREALTSQLGELHENWRKDKIFTLIIVDGLDHIEREQSPERSLLKELPSPENIPEGVLLILGSQTLVLNDFPERIRHHLDQSGRTIVLQPLPRQAVLNIISASALPFALSHDQHEKINFLSNGHPLALRYLLANLINVSDENDIKDILNSTEPYKGHIEENYRIYWDKLQRHEELKELLALLCRLRGPFNPEDLLKWVPEPAVKLLVTQAKHFFRP